jgi:hypothetical protein
MCGELQAPPALLPGKEVPPPIEQKTGGPQRRLGRLKFSFPLLDTETNFTGHPARRLVIKPT